MRLTAAPSEEFEADAEELFDTPHLLRLDKQHNTVGRLQHRVAMRKKDFSRAQNGADAHSLEHVEFAQRRTDQRRGFKRFGLNDLGRPSRTECSARIRPRRT